MSENGNGHLAKKTLDDPPKSVEIKILRTAKEGAASSVGNIRDSVSEKSECDFRFDGNS